MERKIYLHKILFWLLFFICSPFPINADPSFSLEDVCTIIVNAGTDINICADGSPVQLNGSVIGNSLTYFWTPETGLDDPTSLTPTVTTGIPVTYTLSAQEPDNFIPISNGDFQLGNTSFTSDYNYISPTAPIGFINPGSYTIITSPELIWANLPPCDDHTAGNGTGQMLVVNGTGSPGDNIWCTTISGTANTDYYFSGWISTLNPLGTPQIQVSVNGILVGTQFNAGGTPCNWEFFDASFNSGASATFDICVTNQFLSLIHI